MVAQRVGRTEWQRHPLLHSLWFGWTVTCCHLSHLCQVLVLGEGPAPLRDGWKSQNRVSESAWQNHEQVSNVSQEIFLKSWHHICPPKLSKTIGHLNMCKWRWSCSSCSGHWSFVCARKMSYTTCQAFSECPGCSWWLASSPLAFSKQTMHSSFPLHRPSGEPSPHFACHAWPGWSLGTARGLWPRRGRDDGTVEGPVFGPNSLRTVGACFERNILVVGSGKRSSSFFEVKSMKICQEKVGCTTEGVEVLYQS